MVNGDCNIDILGNENKGIGGDNKQSIGGNQELTVMGNQTEHIQGNRTITIDGQESTEVKQSWLEKHFADKTGIYLSSEFSFYGSNAHKITVGNFSEFKYALSTSITGGLTMSVNKAKEVTKKDDLIQVISGKWNVTVNKNIDIASLNEILIESTSHMKIKSVGNMNIDSSKKIDIVAGKGVTVKASKSIEHDGDRVFLKGKRNVIIQVGSNKMAVSPSGVDGKGSLIKFG